MEHLELYIEYIAKIIESLGVLIIAGGILFFTGRFLLSFIARKGESCQRVRHDMGKAILLGLEILVAADIVATVTTTPTMNSVLVLGVIVLIRTFLSFSLHAELEGKLPWQ